MSLTLRQVQFFNVVARTLHFGRAADELFVSQPVVSQEIARLERVLGFELFDRSRRQISLTAAGEALRGPALELTDAALHFEQFAVRFSKGRAATLTMVGTPSAMDYFIPLILQGAEASIPWLQIEDVGVETGEVATNLESGAADLGLGRYVSISDRFRSEVVFREPLMVALSESHPLAGAASIHLGDLADLPLLLWPRERNRAYYDRLMDVCAAGGLDPLVVVSRPRVIGTRSYLIADGRAFGLVPASSAAQLPAGIVALPLDSPEELPLSLVWRADDQRPAVAELVALIRQLGATASRAAQPVVEEAARGRLETS